MKLLLQKLLYQLRRLRYWVTGLYLDAQLREKGSAVRLEAEAAVDHVVLETNIPPDCVTAQVINGGRAMVIRHNGATEVLIHNSYMQAAQEAVKWLHKQGDSLQAGKVSAMTRAQRNEFNARRKRERREKMRARRKAH